MPASGDVTLLLQQIRSGNPEAEGQLLALVYRELKTLASACLRRERANHTLQATALVNEAYLKLLGRRDREWQNRSHFMAVAGHAMRAVLVDYARNRKAHKRMEGGRRVDLDDANIAIDMDTAAELLDLDLALNRLAEWSPRLAQVVECRFFAGMTDAETAKALGLAVRTIQRDWKMARAWLYSELEDMRVSQPAAASAAGGP